MPRWRRQQIARSRAARMELAAQREQLEIRRQLEELERLRAKVRAEAEARAAKLAKKKPLHLRPEAQAGRKTLRRLGVR